MAAFGHLWVVTLDLWGGGVRDVQLLVLRASGCCGWGRLRGLSGGGWLFCLLVCGQAVVFGDRVYYGGCRGEFWVFKYVGIVPRLPGLRLFRHPQNHKVDFPLTLAVTLCAGGIAERKNLVWDFQSVCPPLFLDHV